MARPLKYLEGPKITSLDELSEIISAGGYIIVAATKQRVNPGWAASWQFNFAANAIKRGVLLRAIPNHEHTDKETK